MSLEKINKIIFTLLDNGWDFTDETAGKMLGDEYLELYQKQKGIIVTAYKELIPVKQKLDNMEWHNQHSEYMVEIAKFCQDKKYIEIFEHVLALHNLDGSLNYRLSQYRGFQWEELKKKHKEKLQPLGISPTDIENDLPF